MIRRDTLFVLTLSLGMLTATGSRSQTYVIAPGDTLEVVAPFDNISIHDIYQQNISGDTLWLGWALVDVNLAPGWDYSLCDYGTCYAPIPDSGSMYPVVPTGEGFLGLNINPYQIAGVGSMRVYVYDKNFPNDGDTVTWLVSAGNVGMASLSDVVRVYPNPVQTTLLCDGLADAVSSPCTTCKVKYHSSCRRQLDGTEA